MFTDRIYSVLLPLILMIFITECFLIFAIVPSNSFNFGEGFTAQGYDKLAKHVGFP
jgi:hypothetical protein